jgi:hypothetical protein
MKPFLVFARPLNRRRPVAEELIDDLVPVCHGKSLLGDLARVDATPGKSTVLS